MNEDDIEAIMSEPPFGFNHGRQRSHGEGWIPLGIDEQRAWGDDLGFEVLERQSPRRKTHKPDDTIRHGTRSAYVNRCRCALCRSANAAYEKKRSSGKS